MDIRNHITFLVTTMLIVVWMVHASEKRDYNNNGTRLLSRKLRNLAYPEGATQGIFFALAIPIELPGRSIALSYNYEANYELPFYNVTESVSNPGSEGGERRKRSLDRRRAYVMLEKKLKSKGLNGRVCVLRTICETAETPLQHNGLIGDLLHLFFTPSTSLNNKLHSSFTDAESRGSRGEDCRLAYPECPIGLFDLMSTLDH